MLRLFLSVMLVTSTVCADPIWKPHQSSEGAFQGVFPGPTAESQMTQDSLLGTVSTTILSSSNSLGDYSIACTELPAVAVRLSSRMVISDARKGVLQDAQATEKSWKPFPGGYQLNYRSAHREGWSQILLVGNRLYVLDARLQPGSDQGSLVKPFFAHFSPL